MQIVEVKTVVAILTIQNINSSTQTKHTLEIFH